MACEALHLDSMWNTNRKNSKAFLLPIELLYYYYYGLFLRFYTFPGVFLRARDGGPTRSALPALRNMGPSET